MHKITKISTILILSFIIILHIYANPIYPIEEQKSSIIVQGTKDYKIIGEDIIFENYCLDKTKKCEQKTIKVTQQKSKVKLEEFFEVEIQKSNIIWWSVNPPRGYWFEGYNYTMKDVKMFFE